MKIIVGKRNNILQPSINPITKELEILQNGEWVPASTLVTEYDTQYHGVGKFEPIELSKKELTTLLLYLAEESIDYSYRIERSEGKFFVL